MRAWASGITLGLGLVLVLPTALLAQGAIGGSVKDSTGAVLPGVTVEASSDALIERTRSAVTDANGQYQIVNLRPGTYAVTFTLAGFNASSARVSSSPARIRCPLVLSFQLAPSKKR
jgi:hypothetical protein